MIGIIGGGNMGEAFIEGFLKAGIDNNEILVCEIDEKRREDLAKKYKIKVCDSIDIIGKTQKIILIAVKPYQVKDVCEKLSNTLKNDQLLVSIAAGISLKDIKSYLKKDFENIIRIMPNLMVAVNKGVLATAYYQNIDKDLIFDFKHYFSKLGYIYEVEEKILDAITAISGSGPAFVSVFIESLADAGVYIGIPRNLALNLALNTILGTVSMIKEKNLHPATLKDKITSPAGTTIEGLKVLEENNFRALIYKIILETFNKTKKVK